MVLLADYLQQQQQVEGSPLTSLLNTAERLKNIEPGQLMAANALLERQRAAETPPPQFKFGVLNGATGQMENPGTGEIMQDAQGNALNSRALLANQAQTVNAAKGFEPGQQTPDQVQAQMMTNLGKSIMALPEDQRHLAYERGIGVLMGKGVVNFNEAPPWDKGGRELTKHIAELKSQGDMGVASINAQGNIGAAQAQAQGTLGAAQATAQGNLLKAQIENKGGNNTKLDAAMARTDAAIFKDAQESFDTASAIKANLDSVLSANATASSSLPGRLYNNGRATMGFANEAATANRQIEQASNTLALQMKSLYKMTGAMSDADRAFLQNMVPRAEDTPIARENAVNNLSKYTDYVMQRTTALQAYIQQNGSSSGFNEAWTQAHPGGPVAYITGQQPQSALQAQAAPARPELPAQMDYIPASEFQLTDAQKQAILARRQAAAQPT